LYYSAIKAPWFSADDGHENLVHPGRGTRDVLEELLALIVSRGFSFESFEALVDSLPSVRTP
jgi:hypothetical protein